MTPQNLDWAEAANALRIKEGQLRKWVAARVVPHTRIGKRVVFSPENIAQINAMFEVQPIARPRHLRRAS